MSDVSMAQELVQEAWPSRRGRPVKTCISMIFEALKAIERALPREELRARPKQWTERRVRSIWECTARRIDNYEMADLKLAALEAARHEYQESIERSRRMAAFISAHEAVSARSMAQ